MNRHTPLVFLCETNINNADTITLYRDTITGEFVVTYGDKRSAFVCEDDAKDQYMEDMENAWAVGTVFEA